jgi:hypothetical protein
VAAQVKRHVDTLKKLKESLASREAEKIRHREYKERKKALGPRPTKLEVSCSGAPVAGMRACACTQEALLQWLVGSAL